MCGIPIVVYSCWRLSSIDGTNARVEHITTWIRGEPHIERSAEIPIRWRYSKSDAASPWELTLTTGTVLKPMQTTRRSTWYLTLTRTLTSPFTNTRQSPSSYIPDESAKMANTKKWHIPVLEQSSYKDWFRSYKFELQAKEVYYMVEVEMQKHCAIANALGFDSFADIAK